MANWRSSQESEKLVLESCIAKINIAVVSLIMITSEYHVQPP